MTLEFDYVRCGVLGELPEGMVHVKVSPTYAGGFKMTVPKRDVVRDVVPVIRCKDCRYGSCQGGADPRIQCTRSIGKYFLQRSDDFCSHAKARKGDCR